MTIYSVISDKNLNVYTLTVRTSGNKFAKCYFFRKKEHLEVALDAIRENAFNEIEKYLNKVVPLS